jgi:hypothetical protein
VDRALRRTIEKVAPKTFGANNRHRATERAIHHITWIGTGSVSGDDDVVGDERTE